MYRWNCNCRRRGTNAPVVLMREPGERRVVPIFIGVNEAQTIIRALRGRVPLRPMTHELLGDVLDALDVSLEDVYVDAIQESIYHGALSLLRKNTAGTLLVDSRPSDSLALALRLGAPIFVAPEVLDVSAMIDLEDEVVTALGITVSAVIDALHEALSLPDRPGVLVTRVTGVAETEGMEAGALITVINGETPKSPLRFLELIRDADLNVPAIEFWQEGETRVLELSTDVPVPESLQPRRRIPARMQES